LTRCDLIVVEGDGGAGESVDLNPIIPQMAPIDEVQPRQCPCLRAFES
jgi:hypothetical protein